jgi:hypothetical protein
MALLASKRVRKNFTSQIFGFGDPQHQCLIFAFIKNDVMMPGQYASFLGREFTHHDYLNTCINWSQNDGASGYNRQYYLGFSVVPTGVSSRAIYSDENGLYVDGPLPITVVSEGRIGSVLVYHGGITRHTSSVDFMDGISIPPASATGQSGAYIAIPEACYASNYNNVTAGSYSGFNGTNYVYNVAGAQPWPNAFHYGHVMFITDSVGANDGSVVDVSNMYISASNPVTLNSIRLKVSEAL